MTRKLNRPSLAAGRHPRWRAALVAIAGALMLTGCNIDRLLQIETPSRVVESSYLVPENAGLITSSAEADFACAWGAYIVASGMAAGELLEASQTASYWSYDRRTVLPSDAHYSTFGCVSVGVYTPINTARFTNDQAYKALAGWTDQQVPNRQRLMASSAAYAGYSLLMLGEGFCSGTINVGPELTPQQIFDSAKVRFTNAIAAAQAAGDQNLLNLARVGRARAQRNLNDMAGAAADAALVPENFVYNVTASTSAARRNNRIYARNNSASAVSVAPAFRNLTVGATNENDTRVRAVSAGRLASDQVTELWWQQKYASITSPTPVATGIEAQLILAEARGGTAGFAILQDLRADAGLPPLTAAELADFSATLTEERRRWLWLQGNRWFDIRRGNLTQNPATGSPYSKGGNYGDQRCWPLPDVERLSNPNL